MTEPPASARWLGRLGSAALRSAVSLSADWYWEADASHRITRFELSPRRDCRVTLSPQGLAPWEMPELSATAHWDVYRERIARREVLREFELVYADASGHVRYLQVSGEPVRTSSGRFRGYRGTGHDITAHKEAENALNASESQLAAVIDAAMDAIITIDESGRIVVFNQVAGQMFGCRRSDALGRSLEQFVPQALAFIRAASAPGHGSPGLMARALSVRGRRMDESTFWGEASISRIERRGRCLYCLVLRDLSQRLAAEEARQALEQQLRESQKMEALGAMAGGIAHDFNNIVAAILGNAALAQANLASPSSSQFIQEITKAGLRARDIVQRIMAFSRRQPPVFTCQPLQPLVREGAQLLRATLPSGIDVTVELAERPMHVHADAAQISQVMMNLGTNAWQALGSRPGRIAVSLAERGGQAVLSVSDNGCGMDEATRQRIFEPFFTTKPKGEGTGLGLSVVHGIVQAHGGRITVESTKGVGTTFHVMLPLATEPSPQEAPPEAAPAPARGRGQHIVYLDDYPALVFMVRATLEGMGYRVTGFEVPEIAMAYIDAHAAEVDLFVTDHNMPNHSGLEVAGEIRRRHPSLPVILASGYITDELREGAAAAGVAALFDKPRGIDELCRVVGDVLACVPTQESPS